MIHLFNSADFHHAIVNILKGNLGHHKPELYLWVVFFFPSLPPHILFTMLEFVVNKVIIWGFSSGNVQKMSQKRVPSLALVM